MQRNIQNVKSNSLENHIKDTCQCIGCHEIGIMNVVTQFGDNEVIDVWACKDCAQKKLSSKMRSVDPEKTEDRSDSCLKKCYQHQNHGEINDDLHKITHVLTSDLSVEVQ